VEVTSTKAFVGLRSLPSDKPIGLQPLQQGRQGARVELQAPAELADCDAVFFPEHQQHEVLGIGEFSSVKIGRYAAVIARDAEYSAKQR